MNSVILAALIEVGIITYRIIRNDLDRIGNLPLPGEYLSVIIFFGVLMFGADSSSEGAKKVSTLIAWGMVIATFMNLQLPGLPKTSKTSTSTSTSTSTKGAG